MRRKLADLCWEAEETKRKIWKLIWREPRGNNSVEEKRRKTSETKKWKLGRKYAGWKREESRKKKKLAHRLFYSRERKWLLSHPKLCNLANQNNLSENLNEKISMLKKMKRLHCYLIRWKKHLRRRRRLPKRSSRRRCGGCCRARQRRRQRRCTEAPAQAFEEIPSTRRKRGGGKRSRCERNSAAAIGRSFEDEAAAAAKAKIENQSGLAAGGRIAAYAWKRGRRRLAAERSCGRRKIENSSSAAEDSLALPFRGEERHAISRKKKAKNISWRKNQYRRRSVSKKSMTDMKKRREREVFEEG